MATPRRGEVWLVDFGQAGKTRPAVVVSVALGDQERPLLTVVPHTTALRGSPFEIAVRASFLNTGGFLVQGVTTFPTARALHRLGSLPAEDFDRVFQGLLRWLGHFPRALGSQAGLRSAAGKAINWYGSRPRCLDARLTVSPARIPWSKYRQPLDVRAGQSTWAAFLTSFQSIPKYAWIRMFRKSTICGDGMCKLSALHFVEIRALPLR